MAAWAETEVVLAAEPGATAPTTRARPRRICCAARWAAGLPEALPGHRGGWRCAPTPGYFAGALARTAHDEQIAFAIGAKRIAPLWRLLAGLADDDWHDAIEMDNAQVVVAQYRPDLVARQHPAADPPGPAGPRSRSPPTSGPARCRTLHPDRGPAVA